MRRLDVLPVQGSAKGCVIPEFWPPLSAGSRFTQPRAHPLAQLSTDVVKYRARNKGMQILLSNSQAVPGTTVKQEQEEISRNHVQAFIPGSVFRKAQINYVLVKSNYAKHHP